MLQKEFLELKVEEECKAQLKATEEVQMVKKKLNLELEAKKKKNLIENNAKLGVSNSYSRKHSCKND